MLSRPQTQLTLPYSSTGLSLPNLNWLWREVKASREEHQLLDSAIVEHERAELAKSEARVEMARKGAKSRSSRGGGSRGSGGMGPVAGDDLKVRPPTSRIPSSVPKQVSNQIVWDVVKVDAILTPSAGGIVENNFSFSLQLHPQVSNWAALFDQYCIPQASMTFRSLEPPGGTSSISILYTALDFDNANNLGSIAAIEDYATCKLKTMGAGAVITRSVRPCIKLSTQQPSTNVNSSLAQNWQDVGAGGTPWFGIRSILGVSNSSNIIATSTIWYAFRNQI